MIHAVVVSMSYYTLEFDFTATEQGVKSYISTSDITNATSMNTDGFTICLNCVIFNCVKDRTLQICIGTHTQLMKMGLIDDTNSLNDTVMDSIVRELALLNIQFNPNEHYFTDQINETDNSAILVHTLRIPYESIVDDTTQVPTGYTICDTCVDAYIKALS